MWASCHTHASVLLARTHIHAGMHWCVSNMTLHTGADPLRGYYEHAISGLHQREDGLIYARAVQSSADKLLKIEIHGTLCSFKDLHKHTLAAPKHTCCVRQPFKLRLLSLCPGLQQEPKHTEWHFETGSQKAEWMKLRPTFAFYVVAKKNIPRLESKLSLNLQTSDAFGRTRIKPCDQSRRHAQQKFFPCHRWLHRPLKPRLCHYHSSNSGFPSHFHWE